MIEIVLLRHGAVDDEGLAYGARHDPPLSAAGRDEVRRLRDRLVTGGTALQSALVVASPTRRSAETLEVLGRPADAVDAAWSERDLGDGEGQPWTQLWARAPAEVSTDPDAYVRWTPPGGESVLDLRARIDTAVQATLARAERARTDRVVVVTHAGPIAATLGHVLTLPDVALTRWQLPTASATVLHRHDATAWTVRAVGT